MEKKTHTYFYPETTPREKRLIWQNTPLETRAPVPKVEQKKEKVETKPKELNPKKETGTFLSKIASAFTRPFSNEAKAAVDTGKAAMAAVQARLEQTTKQPTPAPVDKNKLVPPKIEIDDEYLFNQPPRPIAKLVPDKLPEPSPVKPAPVPAPKSETVRIEPKTTVNAGRDKGIVAPASVPAKPRGPIVSEEQIKARREAESKPVNQITDEFLADVKERHGLRKKPESYAESLQKLAEKGNVMACLALVAAYAGGLFGEAPDPQKAKYWLEQAQALPHTEADQKAIDVQLAIEEQKLKQKEGAERIMKRYPELGTRRAASVPVPGPAEAKSVPAIETKVDAVKESRDRTGRDMRKNLIEATGVLAGSRGINEKENRKVAQKYLDEVNKTLSDSDYELGGEARKLFKEQEEYLLHVHPPYPINLGFDGMKFVILPEEQPVTSAPARAEKPAQPKPPLPDVTKIMDKAKATPPAVPGTKGAEAPKPTVTPAPAQAQKPTVTPAPAQAQKPPAAPAPTPPKPAEAAKTAPAPAPKPQESDEKKEPTPESLDLVMAKNRFRMIKEMLDGNKQKFEKSNTQADLDAFRKDVQVAIDNRRSQIAERAKEAGVDPANDPLLTELRSQITELQNDYLHPYADKKGTPEKKEPTPEPLDLVTAKNRFRMIKGMLDEKKQKFEKSKTQDDLDAFRKDVQVAIDNRRSQIAERAKEAGVDPANDPLLTELRSQITELQNDYLHPYADKKGTPEKKESTSEPLDKEKLNFKELRDIIKAIKEFLEWFFSKVREAKLEAGDIPTLESEIAILRKKEVELKLKTDPKAKEELKQVTEQRVKLEARLKEMKEQRERNDRVYRQIKPLTENQRVAFNAYQDKYGRVYVISKPGREAEALPQVRHVVRASYPEGVRPPVVQDVGRPVYLTVNITNTNIGTVIQGVTGNVKVSGSNLQGAAAEVGRPSAVRRPPEGTLPPEVAFSAPMPPKPTGSAKPRLG